VLVTEYSSFLKSMGIEHVPTLYVNNGYEKTFLIGKDAIESYLLCKTTDGLGGKAAHVNSAAPAGTAAAQTGKNSEAANENLLHSEDKPFQIFQPSSKEGMCKEDE